MPSSQRGDWVASAMVMPGCVDCVCVRAVAGSGMYDIDTRMNPARASVTFIFIITLLQGRNLARRQSIPDLLMIIVETGKTGEYEGKDERRRNYTPPPKIRSLLAKVEPVFRARAMTVSRALSSMGSVSRLNWWGNIEKTINSDGVYCSSLVLKIKIIIIIIIIIINNKKHRERNHYLLLVMTIIQHL